MENVRMRLLTFEQLLFWYYMIQEGTKKFLDVVLDTDLVSKFLAYYYHCADMTVEEELRKNTGASTMYNHFGHFATFYKWFLGQKGYKERKQDVLQAYLYCALEEKSE